MSFNEILDIIKSKRVLGSRLTLERIEKVLELFESPQNSLDIVHIAGTNGKGSCSKLIYNALREAGYRTGLYASPYILDFRERIEVDGEWISEGDFASVGREVVSAARKLEASGMEALTEFEMITAIAFVYFKREGCEKLVLEVGLGGRGDATNVIKSPMVSVITSIARDHMEFLGEDLESIAFEKAGIIKKGRPVIFNSEDESVCAVIEKRAAEQGSPCFSIAEAVKVSDIKSLSLSGCIFSTDVFGRHFPDVYVPLAGRHQVGNGIVALAVLELLRIEGKINITDEEILSGFSKTFHPGRFELISIEPTIVIDGAHNKAGMEAFSAGVTEFFGDKRILVFLGILRDKEVWEMVKEVISLGCDIGVSAPDNLRALSAEDLADIVSDLGGRSPVFSGNAEDAIKYVKAHRADYDAVLFAGSLYFVSSIRKLWSEGF